MRSVLTCTLAGALLLTWPAAITHGQTIILSGGSRVEGTIVKQTEPTVFLDIGYDVLKIPRRFATS